MRHRPREEVDKHRKEHVLCQADDHSEYFLQVQKVQVNFNSRWNLDEWLLNLPLNFELSSKSIQRVSLKGVDCQILKKKKPYNFVYNDNGDTRLSMRHMYPAFFKFLNVVTEMSSSRFLGICKINVLKSNVHCASCTAYSWHHFQKRLLQMAPVQQPLVTSDTHLNVQSFSPKCRKSK